MTTWLTYGLHIVLVSLLTNFIYNPNCSLKHEMGVIRALYSSKIEKHGLQTASYGS